jgi:hypothetical protein
MSDGLPTLENVPAAGREPKPDGWHAYHICGGELRTLNWSGNWALCLTCGEQIEVQLHRAVTADAAAPGKPVMSVAMSDADEGEA